VGECFFLYRPTRVVPDQRPLNVCNVDAMMMYVCQVSSNLPDWCVFVSIVCQSYTDSTSLHLFNLSGLTADLSNPLDESF